RTYSVATNNYVTGHADALLGIHGSIPMQDLLMSDRDIILEAFHTQGIIDAHIDGRITILSDHPPLQGQQ
ncbi:MAG: hypothetical protein WB699_05530, partial [Bacteroidota bacterium]